ncbi:MAG: SPOR domain-containing protein [Pseudomonadaceae bacterium]
MAKGRKAPRRGASRAQSAPRRKGIPGWLWAVSGLVVGVFVTFLLQLEPGREEVRRSPEPPKPSNTPAAPPSTPKPQYDFYTLLPESDVNAPQQPAQTAPAATPAPEASKPAASGPSYYLQAGSFRQRSDADQLRAQILLLGMDVKLENATINGNQWYRVQVGPFSNKNSMDQAQRTLSGNGFSNLLPQQR